MTESRFMAVALALAARGLGRVAPNPAVGCVITQDDHIVGRGWTQPGGRPHAETEALARAGTAAHGATAHVTLEPCAHRGRTPPCTEALIEAGIKRCVIAIEDPDPRVAGRGMARLRAAGIAVDVGCLAAEATDLNAGFLTRLAKGRPLVTLKLATSLDGRIATRAGESQWITGPVARRRAHLMRRQHDAIMVGSGTALADDPELSVRLPGLEDPPPWRIVVDGRLRTPLTAKLVRTAASTRTILITLDSGDPLRVKAFSDCGVEVLKVGADGEGLLDLDAALASLGGLGLTRLLCEGGARLAASLMRRNLVDRLAWFRSPSLIGGDGLAALEGFGIDRLADQAIGTRLSVMELGEDLLETVTFSA